MAFAASITSPCRAPCDANHTNTAISAMVRIMMSRLTPKVRFSAPGSNSWRRLDAAPMPRMWRSAIAMPIAAATYSAMSVPVATPRTSQPHPITNNTSSAMFTRLRMICRINPMPVRPSPTNHPNSA